jgi:hypothetical protein
VLVLFHSPGARDSVGTVEAKLATNEMKNMTIAPYRCSWPQSVSVVNVAFFGSPTTSSIQSLSLEMQPLSSLADAKPIVIATRTDPMVSSRTAYQV